MSKFSEKQTLSNSYFKSFEKNVIFKFKLKHLNSYKYEMIVIFSPESLLKETKFDYRYHLGRYVETDKSSWDTQCICFINITCICRIFQ